MRRSIVMSNVKERIIGAVTIMNEQDAIKVRNIITTTFREKEWENIPEELPDDIDLTMIEEDNFRYLLSLSLFSYF